MADPPKPAAGAASQPSMAGGPSDSTRTEHDNHNMTKEPQTYSLRNGQPRLSQSPDIFRFFRLPPELRNMIYGLLTGSLYNLKVKGETELCIHSSNYFSLPLRLVRREFRHEYEAEVLKACQFEISTNDDGTEVAFNQLILDMTNSTLSGVCARLQHVKLFYNLWATETSELVEALQKVERESKLLVHSLPALKTFQLDFGVLADTFRGFCVQGFDIRPYFSTDGYTDGVEVKKFLLISSDLYSVNARIVTNATEAEEMEEDNWIRCYATLAQEPRYSWLGLELLHTDSVQTSTECDGSEYGS